MSITESHNNYYQSWWKWLVADPTYERFNVLNKDWIRKKYNADFVRLRSDSDNLIERGYRPLNWIHVIQDNSQRLFGLVVLERLVALRQAMPWTSKSYLQYGNNTTLLSSMNDMRCSNLFKGLYRGVGLNLAQFFFTYGLAVNLSGGCVSSFVGFYIMYEAMFYPLDTLRTKYIADGNGTYRNFSQVLHSTNPTTMFNGIFYKLAFSAAVGLCFLNDSTSLGCPMLFNAAVMTAAYPLLTLKTISQVSIDTGNAGSNMAESGKLLGRYLKPEGLKSLYRGYTPFLALVLFGSYSFPQLWSDNKKESKLNTFNEKFRDTMQKNFQQGSKNYELH